MKTLSAKVLVSLSLLPVAALGLGAVGCGGSDSSGDDTPAPTAEQAEVNDAIKEAQDQAQAIQDGDLSGDELAEAKKQLEAARLEASNQIQDYLEEKATSDTGQ